MGFAAGFGRGFARSFEAQRERSEARETDMFRYRMEDLIKRRDKYDEWKREDAQFVDRAKSYARITKQDPQTVGWIYNQLKSGVDDAVIIKALQSGKLSLKDQTDEQMTDAGLDATAANPAVQAGNAPAEAQASFDGQSFLKNAYKGMPDISPRRQQRIQDRVMETTGMTADQIAQIDQGYQSPQMNDANIEYTPDPVEPEVNDLHDAKQVYDRAAAKLQAEPDNPTAQQEMRVAERLLKSSMSATQMEARKELYGNTGEGLGLVDVVITDKDGKRRIGQAVQNLDGSFSIDGQPAEQGQIRTRSPEELKKYDEIQKSLGETSIKHNEATRNLAQAYTIFGNARRIIANDEGVLQENTANITNTLVNFGKEVVEAFTLVDNYLNAPTDDPKAAQALDDATKKLEQAAKDPSLDPIKRRGANAALLKAQYALAAYHVMASKGQSGTAVSKQEFDRFRDIPSTATSLPEWDKLIGSILVPEKVMLDKSSQLVPQNYPALKGFKDRYQYSPVDDFGTVEQYLEGTPGAELDQVLPKENFVAPNGTSDTGQSGPGGQPTPVPVKTKAEYDALEPGTLYQHPDGTIKRKK